MEGNEKIKVTSHVDGIVGVSLASRSFIREWRAKNQSILVPFEVLEEAIYDPGFRNMIDQGILSIDNLEANIQLGLEDDSVQKPTNHVIYTDVELRKLLNVSTAQEFEETLKVMPSEAKRSLADMAITLRIRDANKIQLLKKYQNIDITKAIILDQTMEN